VSRARLVQSVGIIMIAMALNSIATFGREVLLAAYFGASVQTDTFNVSLAIANLSMLIISPFSDVFVPVYVGYRALEHQEDAQYLLNAVGSFLVLLLGISALILLVFAGPLVSLYSSGFDSAGHQLTVDLLRLLVPFTVFSGLAAYSVLILTAHKDFIWIGLSPVLGTLVTIAILWGSVPALGIYALAWGFVGGGLTEIVILGLGLRLRRIRFRPTFRAREGLSLLGKLALLMFAVRCMGQIPEIVDRNMLSHLSAGSIAALAFAKNIYSLPFQVFTLGITRVAITYFSWDAARNDLQGLKRNLSLSIRVGAFFMLPAMVGLILLRYPIVQVLYERGNFTAADTQATAAALAWLVLGLFGHAVLFIAVRYFLSRKTVKDLALVNALYVGCRIVFNLLLINLLGHTAIACSTTLAGILAAGAALLLIRRELGALGGSYIARTCLKVLVAAAVMGIFVYLGQSVSFVRLLPAYGQLVGLVVIGFLIYLLTAYLVRLDELHLFVALVRERCSTLAKMVKGAR
jgi:putative peptidoglycan lipid II flippase